MSIWDKIQRRRPIQKWELPKLTAHFTECYAGPGPVTSQRASVILHHPLSTLPKSAKAEDACEWAVFHLEADSYTAGIVAMGDDPRMIVRGWSRTTSVEDARNESLEWTQDGELTPFRFLSKTFQLAVTNFILHRDVDIQDLFFLDLISPADLTDADREWLRRNNL
jgi:hypothetical protein